MYYYYYYENNRNVFILEVGCFFDSSLEEAYSTKLVNYYPLVEQISGLAYKSQYLVLIFSSLGHVHRPASGVSGLLALPKQGQNILPNTAQYPPLLQAATFAEEGVVCIHNMLFELSSDPHCEIRPEQCFVFVTFISCTFLMNWDIN